MNAIIGPFLRCGPGAELDEETLKARQKILAEALIVLSGECEELSVSGKLLGDEAVCKIADSLCRNQQVQLVQLDGNNCGDYAALRLAEALKENLTLKSLDLDYNNIEDVGAVALGTALQSNQVLRSLELHSNGITCEGAKGLAAGLSRNATLKTLGLNNNKIGCKGACAIGEALVKNKSLRELFLGSNIIGNEGVGKISSMLVSNQCIKELHLEGNRMSDEGATFMSEALMQNHTLRELWLTENDIGNDGLTMLTYSLSKNRGLQRLGLTLDKGAANVHQHIKRLKKSHQLRRTVYALSVGETTVQLHGTDLSLEGAQQIAEAVAASTTLRQLRLESCNIGDEGAMKIAAALETNSSLEMVSLACNKIGGAGMTRLKGALNKSMTLEHLDLDGNPGDRDSALPPPRVTNTGAFGQTNARSGRINMEAVNLVELPGEEDETAGANRNTVSTNCELWQKVDYPTPISQDEFKHYAHHDGPYPTEYHHYDNQLTGNVFNLEDGEETWTESHQDEWAVSAEGYPTNDSNYQEGWNSGWREGTTSSQTQQTHYAAAQADDSPVPKMPKARGAEPGVGLFKDRGYGVGLQGPHAALGAKPTDPDNPGGGAPTMFQPPPRRLDMDGDIGGAPLRTAASSPRTATTEEQSV